MINPKENHEIERAIKFLVHRFEESGHNPKPVILHSIRVGLSLCDYGYNKEIVVAGILHDLLEDTGVSYDEIKKEFSGNIAKLIRVNSHDAKKVCDLQECINGYNNCLEYGEDALIIKASDIMDNLGYYQFAKDQKTKEYLLTKWKYFIKLAKPVIGKEKVYKELEKEYEKLCE